MEVQISIPKSQSHKLISLALALRTEVPEAAEALSQVTKAMANGVQIILRPKIPDHTVSQQGYYHKWAREFGKFCGMTHDQMHDEILCICFGSEIRQTPFGDRRFPLQRSSESNRTDYSELIEVLIRTAAEIGFHIPPPIRRESHVQSV